jgi:hypothetical protein
MAANSSTPLNSYVFPCLLDCPIIDWLPSKLSVVLLDSTEHLPILYRGRVVVAGGQHSISIRSHQSREDKAFVHGAKSSTSTVRESGGQ